MIAAVLAALVLGYAVHRVPPADDWRGLRMAAVVLVAGALVALEVKTLGY